VSNAHSFSVEQHTKLGKGISVTMHEIKRVLVVGGTHGNELTGIYLVKKFERSPHLIKRSSFESLTLFANPKAHEIGKRYVETDLNRCFRRRDLENLSLCSYEAQRAKEIYQTFGSRGSQPADFVIDLHSTTSNMGLSLILASKHPVNLQLAAYVTSVNPNVKLLYSDTKNQDNHCLDALGKFGCTVEVGPIAQNTLGAVLFQQTEVLIDSILDYLEAYNQGHIKIAEQVLTLYEYTGVIDYPRNEQGEIQAMIHPQIQFRDYEPLNPGQPIFLTFDGHAIAYEGTTTVYPIFINEAAYYEKKIAMCITRQQREIVSRSNINLSQSVQMPDTAAL
jgi:aspartoacylase